MRFAFASISTKTVLLCKPAIGRRWYRTGFALLLFTSSFWAQTIICDINLNHAYVGGPGAEKQQFNCNLSPVALTSRQRYWTYIDNQPIEGFVDVTVTGGYPMYNSAGLDGYTARGSSQCQSQRFAPQLTIHFSKPIMNFAIHAFTHSTIRGETGGPVIGIANTGETVIHDGEACCNNGMTFQTSGITDVTFTSTTSSPNWYLALRDYNFTVDPLVCEPCRAEGISRPPVRSVVSNWPGPFRNWSMTAEVSDDDGLVLRDVKLGDRYMAEQISVPYFTLQTTAFPKQRGELKPNSPDAAMRSSLVNYNVFTDDQKVVVTATYKIDRIPGTSESCLLITQVYEFYRENALPCEPSGTEECSNYRASVKYEYSGRNGESLSSINVVQRKKDKVAGYTRNTASVFKDCNGVLECFSAGGLVFKNKQNPLFSEHRAVVIQNGKSTDSWDNIHVTYRGVVDEPLDPTLLVLGILGGCPECDHTHWRWGDPSGGYIGDVDRFNNNKPYVPEGSSQTLEIAVSKAKAEEDDPIDFAIVVNQERIRHPATGADLPVQVYSYTAPDEIVTWFSASSSKRNDSFFNSQQFFAPSDSNVATTISSGNAPALTDKSSEAAGLLDADGPTGVIFGQLFRQGSVTYTGLDAGLVGSVPEGYTIYNDAAYAVRTEAEASGPHTVTMTLPSISAESEFQNIRILHAEMDPSDPTQTIWVDRTILAPDANSPDFNNRTVSARVNYLGGFVVAVFTPPPPYTASSDLSVSLSESSDPLVAGNNLTYSISVTNNGPDLATEVVLINALSPNSDFVSAATSQGSCVESEGRVVCKLNNLNANSSSQIAIVTRPAETAVHFPAEGITVSNTAYVKAREIDVEETNNLVSASTTVLPEVNNAPAVTITNPVYWQLLVGPTNITINATASDPDGTISKVEFFDNGQSIGLATPAGSGTYGLNWNDVPYGSHSLIAKATDNLGKESISGSVSIHVNGPATVNFVIASGETFMFNRPSNITFTAQASYSAGSIAGVEFYAGGASIGQGTHIGGGVYRIIWNDAPVGKFAIRAVATDNNGIKSVSLRLNVTVNDGPAVSITTPLTGTRVSAPIQLVANASDIDGVVTGVDFYSNGSLVARGSYTGRYQYTATWEGADPGSYTVTAVARDNNGGSNSSAPINVTVNSLPNIAITSPISGAQYSAPANVVLTANASDVDGSISQVTFYANGNLIGAGIPTGGNQFNFAWNNVTTGIYSVTAVASDNDGGTTTSASSIVKATSPALLVVGSTALTSSDAVIKSRMEALGYVVTVTDGASSATSDATGKKVLVISSTVTPTTVGTKFRSVSVPIVTWETGLFYDLGLTAKQTNNFGNVTGQTQINIIDASHPLAAGLSGIMSVVTSSNTFSWGKPNANAISIGTLLSDSSRRVVFGYQTGSVMPGLTAPARRVGLFMHDATASSFNSSGNLLFDAAVKWAAGP